MAAVRLDDGKTLAVGILGRKNGDERLLAREVVTSADLVPARDETWLRGLQTGALGTDLARLHLRVLPGANEDGQRLGSYFVELRDGDRSFRRSFSIASLTSVARRAVLRLAESKSIDAEEDYHFFLTTLADDEGAAPEAAKPRATHRLDPPQLESARLVDFLDHSQLLSGSPDPEEDTVHAPLFVSADVWEQGHAQARRGGMRESAAVWTGRLFRDTDSPAVFMVLEACIEAEHADEEPLAVTFSGETWARVREVLELRRRRLNRPFERILGAVHGHNFKSEADDQGKPPCAACPTAKVCGRTTAVLSAADLAWHRAVFAAQPWAVSLVWGYSARGEDWRMYGLADAILAPRPVYLLSE